MISSVSADGVLILAEAMLPYCGRSSRNLLLQANTLTHPAAESCPLRVLQQLAANVATDSLSSSLSDIILPKLLDVVIVCLRRISDVSIHGKPLSSSQVW